MSGHNKWSQIKHRKGAQDAKRSALFSKLLPQISLAAKSDPNPETNTRLRALLEKARAEAVPKETIDRALRRAGGEKDLREFTFECIGPEGVALLIEGVTDNSNRTLQELRILAEDLGCKSADPGSLRWAFAAGKPKFPQPVSAETRLRLREIVSAFEEHAAVGKVLTTAL